MIEFKEIELSDKEWADELLSYSDFRGCEYSFGNNFMWKGVYNLKITRFKDFYILKNDKGFFFPAGRGDLREVIFELKNYSYSVGMKFNFITMNTLSMNWLKENYDGEFEFDSNRDMYDYIYTSESLSTLRGKKLHSKRNHINRFHENNWNYEKITEQNIGECMEMSLEWCEVNEVKKDIDKRKEACAVNKGFNNFFKLGLTGGLLRVDGKVNAFTFGEKLNSETFVVHVEKALTDYQGTYTAINYEFINHECLGYKYINREEDLGIENLRKAKLSYKPEFLEEKYTAVDRKGIE